MYVQYSYGTVPVRYGQPALGMAPPRTHHMNNFNYWLNYPSVALTRSCLDFIFQISDFEFHISNFRFHMLDFRFRISYFGFQIPEFISHISVFIRFREMLFLVSFGYVWLDFATFSHIATIFWPPNEPRILKITRKANQA